MANSRRFYASAVLADGRALVAGGEYSDAGGDTDKAEIYNPVTNTWTSIGNPGWGVIGDAVASPAQSQGRSCLPANQRQRALCGGALRRQRRRLGLSLDVLRVRWCEPHSRI